MEAGRNLLVSPPPFPQRTHASAPAATSMPTTSLARNFPTSVLLREQREEYRVLCHILKEERTSEATLDMRQMLNGAVQEEISDNSDQLVQDFERRLLQWPGLWPIFPSLQTGGSPSSSLAMQPVTPTTDGEKSAGTESCLAAALAMKSLSASKQAAPLLNESKLARVNGDGLPAPSLDPASLVSVPLDKVRIVRSTRLLERRSKKRVPKVGVHETFHSRRTDIKRKSSEGFDPNDPLRMFLWGPETKQLLTAKEEFELIDHIQDMMKLEEVKSRLLSQFGHEPTLIEWAEAAGISCRVLQSQLRTANKSREKLINANLRMVVHIAKQYLGKGLSFPDLLQEGSMGLMKSVEKFKPQAGCRFATYAYWWIRQTVRKAIFQHSRTIRLPENVYTLLGKVLEAKKSCIQEGNHRPTKEELARRVGITVEKLEKLLYTTRMPLSMQQPVWAGQDTTFQEIIADTEIEIPDISVGKQMMRQHVRNLLSILSPKERRIIRLRFGIEDGKQKSLSEIGAVFGLSKERVRQLESRALYRLKQCLSSQGLGAYTDLLV
uniref:Sigma factor n=1 Tax=Francoa sonchifolia TaxID=23250 RepID=A0A0G2STR6_9ROSI|nr:sigma factor [Francoa sonchifolia]